MVKVTFFHLLLHLLMVLLLLLLLFCVLLSKPSFWTSGGVFSVRGYEYQHIGLLLALSSDSVFSNLDKHAASVKRESVPKKQTSLLLLLSRVPSLNPLLPGSLSPCGSLGLFANEGLGLNRFPGFT